jgi:hypothetical protein
MSLFELVLALTILSSITALGIANFPSIDEAANAVNTRRNAQQIALTYNSAVSSGYEGAAASVAEAVEAVTAGIPVSVGSVTYRFKVEGLSTSEVEFAQNHLSLAKDAGKTTLVFLKQ